MDALTLLGEAHAAGLMLAVDGDRLRVRGPKAAEPVVRQLAAHKPAIIAVLAEAVGWRARHDEALKHWRALHPPAEADALAWGEIEGRWHRLRGERAAHGLCAGCRKPIGAAAALDLSDGNRVHIDTLTCLIRHGARWRAAATKALAAMGLQPPAGSQQHLSNVV